jgi:hypothetical protein
MAVDGPGDFLGRTITTININNGIRLGDGGALQALRPHGANSVPECLSHGIRVGKRVRSRAAISVQAVEAGIYAVSQPVRRQLGFAQAESEDDGLARVGVALGIDGRFRVVSLDLLRVEVAG